MTPTQPIQMFVMFLFVLSVAVLVLSATVLVIDYEYRRFAESPVASSGATQKLPR